MSITHRELDIMHLEAQMKVEKLMRETLEIFMGDQGGLCARMLVVEVEGVDYPQNKQGGPILPVFKTAKLSHDLIDRIYFDLAPNECCLTNGPVFSDFE